MCNAIRFHPRLYNSFHLTVLRFTGLVQLDQLDSGFLEAMKILAVKDEGREELPGIYQNKLGLASILTEIIYIIT